MPAGLYWYWAIFAAVLSTVIVPLPEEAALLGAGYAARLGRASFFGVTLAAWLAVILGDIGTFLVGRALLARLLGTPLGRRIFAAERRAWAEGLVKMHAARAIILARFLVGLRGFIYLVIGEARYPVVPFILIDAAVGLAEVGMLVGAGYWFGALRARVGRELDLAVAVVLVLAMITPFVVRRLRTRAAT